jgi:DNA-binding LacI/PurR family transcriptional regulator
MPVRKRVDAVIIASLVLTDEEAGRLAELDCPLAMLGVEQPGHLSARIDDRLGAQKATEHLLSLGHTRIALVAGETDDPMRFTPPHLRRVGYLDALAAAGLDSDPNLERLGYFTIEGGEAAAQSLMANPNPPSDEMAYGAMRAVRRAGLRIPEDIAVIGFDDHESAALMDLSTIRQPVAEQASVLTTRLLDVIGKPDSGKTDDIDEVLPTELVVRGSTDPRFSQY